MPLFSFHEMLKRFLVFALMALANVAAVTTADAQVKASHFTLDNGMEVVVIPDRRAPIVTHMVWYRVGSADEVSGESGIAHFLEHLMFKGTEKIPRGAFSQIIARNGGQDNAFTNYDYTAYFQRVAKDRLELVMSMEADRMINLRLLEKDVLTELEVVKEERRTSYDNRPGRLLGEQMNAALYLNHPYGRPNIGWAHEIAELNRKTALDFYKRFYAPNNAILIVAGDVTPEGVLALAKKIYGKIPKNPKVFARPRPKEPPQISPRRLVLKSPRAGKPQIRRYYLAPAYTTAGKGEAEALELLLKVLADGTTSRIYKELVVKRKVASSAGGWYYGVGRDYGDIGVSAVAADGASLDDVEAALDKVIADVIENGITQGELDRARNLYLADWIYSSDSQSTLARVYGAMLTVGNSVEDIENWPARLKKVTLDDVARAAKKYLDINRSVTGRLIPAPSRADAGAATDKSVKKEG